MKNAVVEKEKSLPQRVGDKVGDYLPDSVKSYLPQGVRNCMSSDDDGEVPVEVAEQPEIPSRFKSINQSLENSRNQAGATGRKLLAEMAEAMKRSTEEYEKLSRKYRAAGEGVKMVDEKARETEQYLEEMGKKMVNKAQEMRKERNDTIDSIRQGEKEIDQFLGFNQGVNPRNTQTSLVAVF